MVNIMKFKKATDIVRDMFFEKDGQLVCVMGIVEHHVVFKESVYNPKILFWRKFLSMYTKIDPKDYPAKLCKCGCGEIISRYESRGKMFKNNTHKGRYYSRLKTRRLRL